MSEAAAKVPVIGTHGSQFHLDDALCCFMLRQLPQYHGARIVRSVDPAELEKVPCDVIVDIGGEYDHARLRYDHHQRGFFEYFSEETKLIKLSASGLVWRHYGKDVIRALWPTEAPMPTDADVELLYNKLYTVFIASVDAGDNGIEKYKPGDIAANAVPIYHDSTSLAHRVKGLNPRWNEKCTDEQRLERFERASAMAGAELQDSVRWYVLGWLPARQIVAKAFSTRRQTAHPSGHVMVLGKGESCPYNDHLRELEDEELKADPEHFAKVFYAVVWDQARSQWAATAVSKMPGSFECRLPFPSEWRGLRDDALSEKAGVQDAVFVHASGFLACNKTTEGIKAMINKSMEIQSDALAKAK